MDANRRYQPFDLRGLETYALRDRPSKVFHTDLGRPVNGDAAMSEWLAALPKQLAARGLLAVRDHLCRAYAKGHPVVAAIGGHVIKTGCGPYLIDWIERGLLHAVAMNGSAAIHDLELAVAGKTSEDVASQLKAGKFGMARETADAFAVAAHQGCVDQRGLGWALGRVLANQGCAYPDTSVLLAAYRAGIPATVHVALGTDIVHMHPHVSGSALGEASMIDFRLLCSVVARMEQGVWLNLGSAVIMPEVFLKVVSVVRNFGYKLEGLVSVNFDKHAHYRSRVNVVERPVHEGIEILGHHELLIPLLHAAVAARLAADDSSGPEEEEPRAKTKEAA